MDITHKIDAVTTIGKDRIAMGGIQPPPKSMKIELTARCNLRCKYCGLATRDKQPAGDMDLEFFKAITKDMRMSGVEEIGVFFLGEPFMAPKLLADAVRWCKKDLGFPWVFLTSNATSAAPENVKAVMEAGLDSLKWSCNFRTAYQFNLLTGGSEKLFFKGVENIHDAFKIRNRNGYKTIISASSIRFDEEEVEKMERFIDIFVRDHVDKHYWLPMYQMGMYREKIEKELGFVPTAGNMGRLIGEKMEPSVPPLPCWTVFTEGHVRVDGGLSACCFGADARFDMGMLDGKNFMEQWNSKKFQKLRKSHIETLKSGSDALKKTPCRVCVAYGE
jgi:pyruvate-formate lyase-activating enzyme